jgi:antitoxin component YwqK of YwqJK toxin-antitoxin module
MNVTAEEQYPDFNNPIEIAKIRAEAVLGTWTKLTNKTLPFDEFRQKNGIQYLRSDEYPYSGYYIQEDENKKIRSLRYFKEGLLDGPVVSWRENGLRFHQGFYQKGKKHGLFEFWSETNVKNLEQNFNDGNLDGLSIRWYKNGSKRSEQIFQNGKILTAIGWKPNGERCTSTRVIDGVGVLVVYDDLGEEKNRQEFENEGKNRTVERYENGNIREEGYYKNGKKDGLWIFYSIDGSEHFRLTFREGIRIKTEFSSNPRKR